MPNCTSFEFRLRVSLTTDGDLTLISRIRNINGKPFSFSFAYHTYLLVSDIRYENFFLVVLHHDFHFWVQYIANWLLDYLAFSADIYLMICLLNALRNFVQEWQLELTLAILYSEIRIEGLETLDYLDNLSQKERFTEQGDAITFESEVNPVGYIYVNS